MFCAGVVGSLFVVVVLVVLFQVSDPERHQDRHGRGFSRFCRLHANLRVPVL